MEREKILGEVQALRYELQHLDTRAQARDLKRRVVELHQRGTAAPPSGTFAEISELAGFHRILDSFLAEARDRIQHVFGTSAWDEPESAAEALARTSKLPPLAPAPGSEPLLVDAELAELEYRLEQKADQDRPEGSLTEPVISAKLALRLVAEVRRLRELTHDAEDGLRTVLAITSRPEDISGGRMYERGQEVLASLIKHRDGKA